MPEKLDAIGPAAPEGGLASRGQKCGRMGHAIDGREEGEEERKQGQRISYCVCVLLASCTYN